MLGKNMERITITLHQDTIAGLDRMAILTDSSRSKLINDCVIQEFVWWHFLLARFHGPQLQHVSDKILAAGTYQNTQLAFSLKTLKRRVKQHLDT